MADVSFNIANPYQQQQEELSRRQKMAEILQQQSFQPIERTSYAGIEAPISPYAGLAKMLQAYAGAKGQQKVAEERAALADEARNRSSMEGREFIGALKGTPEIPMPAEELGGGPGRPAQGPDMARALEMSMNSVNPMVQGAGGAMLSQMLKPSETAFGKVDPKDYTPESVKAFSVGGGKDFSILVPRIKYERENTGSDITVVNPYDPTGKPVSIIPKTISPDTKATLAQAQELANRSFYNMSAAQQAQDRREAQHLGISIEQLNLNKWQTQNPAMSFHEGEDGPVAFNPRTGVAAHVTTPTGAPLLGGKPLTETQGKATGFASRASESDQIINTVGDGGNIKPSLIKAGAEAIPLIGGALGTAANVIAPSSQQQQIEQAQRNFVNAILRQESGASISPSEFANAQRQYFPQVGDAPEVIRQKAANRQTAINSLKVQAGPGMQRMPQQQSAQQPMRAKNSKTGEEIISLDGGNTWQPAGR